MDSLFTPNWLRVRRLSTTLSGAPLPALIGTHMTLRAEPGGFENILEVLRRDVGPVVGLDASARALALATLTKYDFCDLRVTMEASNLERHAAHPGIKTLRQFGLFTMDVPPEHRHPDDPELFAQVLAMYEDGVTPNLAHAHVFARARRSWWSRITDGDNVRGRLPADLIIERAFVSNCTMSPWPFSYL